MDQFKRRCGYLNIHDKPEHEALYNYFEHRKALFTPLNRNFICNFGSETRDELTAIADFIY